MKKVLVSACLLGERVRYDGASKPDASAVLRRWLAEGRVVPVCPEVLGGLPVPRAPAELQADGRVVTAGGEDVSAAFRRGADAALALAREHGAALAVLKEASPSCGSGFVYDGSYTRTPRPGVEGLTTRRLREAGVPVFSECQWEEAARALASLEGS